MAKINLWFMAGLDIFLESLTEEDYKKYKKNVSPKPFLSPLKCWGFSSDFFSPKTALPTHKKDRAALEYMKRKFSWQTELTEILTNPYDALIVTDFSQSIIWTNPGFFEMTGYTGNYVLGKKPSFLQGVNTSKQTKYTIRKKLLQNKPFTEKILNYKKNQNPYWCQIKIFPMQTSAGVSHFLALETELK